LLPSEFHLKLASSDENHIFSLKLLVSPSFQLMQKLAVVLVFIELGFKMKSAIL
jgi:hypothetical protein